MSGTGTGTSYNPPVKRKIFSCDFEETENGFSFGDPSPASPFGLPIDSTNLSLRRTVDRIVTFIRCVPLDRGCCLRSLAPALRVQIQTRQLQNLLPILKSKRISHCPKNLRRNIRTNAASRVSFVSQRPSKVLRFSCAAAPDTKTTRCPHRIKCSPNGL